MNDVPLLPLHLQVFAVGVMTAFLGWVLYLVRYHRLSLRDSLLWLLSTTVALGSAVYPGPLFGLARLLNIAVPANALFVIAFVYVLLNLLAATVASSSASSRIRRLTQECALLRAEVDELKQLVSSRTTGGEGGGVR